MPHIRKSRKNMTRHSRKSIRKTNKRRKSTKRSSRKMRGGGGCDKQQGGADVGDGSNLDGLSKNHYYPLSNDNRLANVNLSSTQGGGKRKGYKRMRGGASGASGYSTIDAITSTGNSNSAYIAPNLLSNANVVDPDVYRQPVTNTYGSIHSAPLV